MNEGRPLADGLEMFGHRVLEHLWLSILETRAASEGVDIEPSEHDAFAEQQADTFVGRAAVLRELMHTAEHRSGVFVVSGKAGVGKTGLVAAFAQHYAQTHGAAGIVTHFVGPIPGSDDIRKALLGLVRQVCGRQGLAWRVPEDYGELREIVPVILAAAARNCPGGKLVVVIDGIDQLSEAHGAPTLNWLPATLPENLLFVLAVREGPAEALLRARAGVAHLVLSPLSIADKSVVVRALLGRYRKRLDESSFNNQLALLVGKREAAYPLYLTVACEELRVAASFEGLTDTLRAMPPGVAGLFEQTLRRLEADHTPRVMQTIFRLFAAARGGIREQDVLALLCRSDIPNASPAMLARVFRSLEALLVCSGSNRAMLLFHAELVRAVEVRYVAAVRELTAAHDVLASHYLSLADPRSDLTFTGRDLLALSQLPFHLSHAGRLEDLELVLCNLSFIQACCAAGTGYDLLLAYSAPTALRCPRARDITASFTAGDIHEYGCFVARNMHILAVKPRLVLQQAFNEPAASAPARAAAIMMAKSPDAVVVSKKKGRRAAKPLAASCPLVLWGNKPDNVDSCVRTVSGLLHPVLCVALSGDGLLTAVGLRSGAVHLYESETGREVWTVQAHASSVTDLCFVGVVLVSASADCSIAVWSRDGQRQHSVKEHSRRVSAVVGRAQDSFVVSASWDATVRVVSLKDGSELGCLRLTQRPVNCLALHPQDSTLALGDWSGERREK